MENLLHDLRYAWRVLQKSPAFAATALLTLALGIGASTTMFSIVNAVLLQPLPFPDSERLVRISFQNPVDAGSQEVPYSVPEMEDVRAQRDLLEGVSVSWTVSANLTGAERTARLEFAAVSPDYFSMLGARPEIGRLIDRRDVADGFAEAIVISYNLWQRSFGGAPDVIGRQLRLDNDPYTIVGVLPRDFRHPGRTTASDIEVWSTAGFTADPFGKPARSLRFLPGMIGKLKAGVTLEQAQTRFDALSTQLRHDNPNDYVRLPKWTIRVESLQQALVGNVRPMLLVLMGAVGLIVLLTSVNLANLLLARAAGRQREIAIRLALGANRGRMVRQLLTESVLLSVAGGAAGILASAAGLEFVLRFVPATLPRLHEVRIDAGVLAFAVGLSVVTGLVFGLIPALQSSRVDLSAPIREGSLGAGQSAKASRWRSVLIMSELALAVVLMVGAGLLLRTLWKLLQENPGFNPEQVVAASVWLPVPNDPKTDKYADPAARTKFLREVQARLDAVPGVQLSSFTSALPTTGQGNSTGVVIEDRPATEQGLRAEFIRATPNYFSVIRAPMMHGRNFAESDEAGKLDVAIVDETTARLYWPSKDPLGQRIKLSGAPDSAPWFTIVGVVHDIKQDGLDRSGVPHVYRPFYQQRGGVLNVALRTTLPVAVIEAQVRQAVQAADPALPIFGVKTMTDVIDVSLAPRRFSARLLAGFAALALVLASVGVYGLVAYTVSQRAREIGIRLALGATPQNIRRLLLGQGTLLAGGGIAIGLVLAALAAPAMAALLYGVAPMDWPVFGSVALVLFIVALVATYLPAHRAAKSDPIRALRES